MLSSMRERQSLKNWKFFLFGLLGQNCQCATISQKNYSRDGIDFEDLKKKFLD